jgi:hypothetical protein
MTHRFAAFLIVLAVSTPTCLAQVVTVRLVDVKSLRPLKGTIVRLRFQDLHPLRIRSDYLDGVTDKEGRAAFELPEPTPDRVLVEPQIQNWDMCSHLAYETPKVLRSGVVGQDFCRYADLGFSAKPGEIVLFVRHISFWERLRSFGV